MKKLGFVCSLVVVLFLVSLAFASWKGTGLKLGFTTQGSNTQLTQSLSYKQTSVTNGTFNSTDVSGVNIVKVDTSSGNSTINGFSAGYDGQVLQVVITQDNSNGVTLAHSASSGYQNIYLQNESNQQLATLGGWTLVCNGTAWHEIDN